MVLRPILRTIQRKILRPLIAAAQRVFITLNGTDAFYSVENILVFGSGDTFEFEFLAPAVAVSTTEVVVDGDDGTNRGLFALASDGSYNLTTQGAVSVDGITVDTNDSYPTDGKFHKVVMSLTGANKIKFLGSSNAQTLFYSGIISNPKATISGVTTAWQLDRLTGNTEQAANGNNLLTYVNIPTGAPDRELFTKNTSTDPDQWENADKSRIIPIA